MSLLYLTVEVKQCSCTVLFKLLVKKVANHVELMNLKSETGEAKQGK
jgi:hypothetical protein